MLPDFCTSHAKDKKTVKSRRPSHNSSHKRKETMRRQNKFHLSRLCVKEGPITLDHAREHPHKKNAFTEIVVQVLASEWDVGLFAHTDRRTSGEMVTVEK